MYGFDRQQLFSALILAVTALFVASAVAPATRWRGALRLAAILGFAGAVVVALLEIVFWWIGPPGRLH